MLKALVFPFVLSASLLTCAQGSSPGGESLTPPVILGVASPVTAGLDISREAKRDQIIRSLQSAVQNRKPSTEVQAVALNGNDMKKAAGVAKDNNCDYVLLTSISVDRILRTPSGSRAGVQSPVGSREGGGDSKLTMQYSLVKPGQTKPALRGTVLTPDNVDGYDVGRALRISLDDLSNRVLKDIQKLSASGH